MRDAAASIGRVTTTRTTVSADASDLETLRAEAQRRGTSLSAVLAEAVSEKAAAVRRRRRPTVGVAESRDGRSAAEVAGDPVAWPPR
jgi:hypothetical protein